jgi:thiol-disulfide isomerase/thioredoxin
MLHLRGIAALAVCLMLGTIAYAQAAILAVGDPAPRLAGGTWLKGKPVAKLDKGTIYVVEFWATWCGPCRQTIPHLTQLQKQYPDIVFIGQNCMERNQTAAPQFVKEMGDQMDYRVVTDVNNRMVNTWFKAAGQSGIPCAFVVDKDGNIAWIGHPMQLDKVLKGLVGGKEVSSAALHVGSPAPALTCGKWIKGEPVEALEQGQVYVIEFWATWCPPCRQSIPHMTQLQKKYPAITFIGQHCAERNVSSVEPFVKEMGNQMNYRVAMDDQNKMARTWLEAARIQGIPTAFVVGRDSKIAWIGHPMELDTVLPRLARAPRPTTNPAK